MESIHISRELAKYLVEDIAAQHYLYLPFNEGGICICGAFIEDCIMFNFKNNLDKAFGFEGYYG